MLRGGGPARTLFTRPAYILQLGRARGAILAQLVDVVAVEPVEETEQAGPLLPSLWHEGELLGHAADGHHAC